MTATTRAKKTPTRPAKKLPDEHLVTLRRCLGIRQIISVAREADDEQAERRVAYWVERINA